MNIANAIPMARFNALLVEGDKGLGLERTLRDQGCAVQRVSSCSAAEEGLEIADAVIISAAGFSAEEVLDLVGRAALSASILVNTDNTDLAVKAARLGASIALGGSVELVSAQIGQLLAVVDLKRRVARPSSAPGALASPTSGVVQRRSTPLPKEATPEALDALIEAAEGLVPMHKFQRVYVDYALRRFGGNKVHTAAALGIDRRTIQRWARARADVSPIAARELLTSS
ncbi:MAG TPA: helix-turn-helix domain-containing protein [Labilithrix sp.]|nr:helix-turn-helix domain-containing protein [Labilithrix sp.]